MHRWRITFHYSPVAAYPRNAPLDVDAVRKITAKFAQLGFVDRTFVRVNDRPGYELSHADENAMTMALLIVDWSSWGTMKKIEHV